MASNKNRNSFPFVQWITACIIVVLILLVTFAVMQISSDPTAGGIIAPIVSPATTTATFPSNPIFPTETTTTTTTTTTTVSTTVTTTTTTSTTAPKNTNSGKITAEYANVRTGPGSSFDLIKPVYRGESYSIVGQAEATNGVLWYEIDLGSQKGYVCAAFVSTDTPAASNRKAYLTFDDGPSANTAKILDILDRYNVKATFFVIYNKEYSNTYSEIVKRGHTLALHSYTHTYSKIYAGETAYFNDLNKLSDHVSQLTGVTPKIIRFPGGSSNTVSKKYCIGIMTELTKEVTAKGYIYHDWNVDSGDADAKTVDKDILVENIRSRLGSRSRAVILMHDSHSKTTTVEALPEMIEYIQSRGYEILPITEDTEPVHHSVQN